MRNANVKYAGMLLSDRFKEHPSLPRGHESLAAPRAMLSFIYGFMVWLF